LKEFSVEKLVADYKDFVSKIGEAHLVEGKFFLQSFLEKSHNVIFEGAQGALLDTEYPHLLFLFSCSFDFRLAMLAAQFPISDFRFPISILI
jgi:adenylosuccinate synthase